MNGKKTKKAADKKANAPGPAGATIDQSEQKPMDQMN